MSLKARMCRKTTTITEAAPKHHKSWGRVGWGGMEVGGPTEVTATAGQVVGG